LEQPLCTIKADSTGWHRQGLAPDHAGEPRKPEAACGIAGVLSSGCARLRYPSWAWRRL